MLTGKTILLGVTGGIACYKIASLASMLKKHNCNTHVVMTQNATEFISPLTFEALTGNRCVVDTFDRNFAYDIEHVSLAKQVDLVLIAPATANVISKLAHGLADDMLTTTLLACDCPKLISPSMNTSMYKNAITQDNIALLKHYGFIVIEPDVGNLACGDTGVGKMPSPEELYDYIERELSFQKDLDGKKVLITAGPTQEAIDPVRFITNHSSGKMGYALAKAAMLRGAEVTLVTGQTNIAPPRFTNVIPVISAEDMFCAVTSNSAHQDLIIKAAAVADFTPANVSDEKIKKADGNMNSISLNRTKDILKWLSENRKPGQFLCGFSMETENVLENSRSKLHSKKVDMIVANSIRQEGAGFAGNTNILTIITADEEVTLKKMSKDQAAHRVLDAILKSQK